MEPYMDLLALSFAMLVGSFLAGMIPLVMKMSDERRQIMTAFGAGLLVGTALAIIIPEGINSVNEAANVAYQASLAAGESASRTLAEEHHDHGAGHIHEHGSCQSASQSLVGFVLTLGFLVMMLIDQLGSSHGHSHGPSTPTDVESGTRTLSSKSSTTTIGLVVHAAADGIALGAAVASERPTLEMLVFFAIMLHKGPAAFGLTSFLIYEGVELSRVRLHLLIFSLAAPLMAIVTYAFLQYGGNIWFDMVQSTGLALLFSAGTFLYVATVHVLPEITNSASNGNKGMSRATFLAMVFGVLLPLVLGMTHHH